MADAPLAVFAAVILIAAAGAFIQRVSGFGFGIFVMIFLPHLLSVYGEANLLSNLMSVAVNALILAKTFRHADWKAIPVPAIAFAAVSVPAVLLLKNRPGGVLFILLGAVMILLSVWFIFLSSKVKIKTGLLSGAVCGGLSGFLGGMFSMSGPPAVVYFLETSENDGLRYIGTIQAYFLITNTFACGVKIAGGFMTLTVLALFAAGLCGVAAGLFAGNRLYGRLDAKKLRTVVYVFMALTGAFNIVTGILRCAD